MKKIISMFLMSVITFSASAFVVQGVEVETMAHTVSLTNVEKASQGDEFNIVFEYDLAVDDPNQEVVSLQYRINDPESVGVDSQTFGSWQNMTIGQNQTTSLDPNVSSVNGNLTPNEKAEIEFRYVSCDPETSECVQQSLGKFYANTYSGLYIEMYDNQGWATAVFQDPYGVLDLEKGISIRVYTNVGYTDAYTTTDYKLVAGISGYSVNKFDTSYYIYDDGTSGTSTKKLYTTYMEGRTIVDEQVASLPVASLVSYGGIETGINLKYSVETTNKFYASGTPFEIGVYENGADPKVSGPIVIVENLSTGTNVPLTIIGDFIIGNEYDIYIYGPNDSITYGTTSVIIE